MLIVVSIIGVFVFAIQHNIDFEHYRKYLLIVFVAVLLLATGVFRLLYRLALVWFYRVRTGDDRNP